MANISEAGTMKGYKLKTWFMKNKEDVKKLLMGVSAVATYLGTGSLKPWLQISLTVVVPTAIKLSLDALDFWLTDVKL